VEIFIFAVRGGESFSHPGKQKSPRNPRPAGGNSHQREKHPCLPYTPMSVIHQWDKHPCLSYTTSHSALQGDRRRYKGVTPVKVTPSAEATPSMAVNAGETQGRALGIFDGPIWSPRSRPTQNSERTQQHRSHFTIEFGHNRG